MVFQSIFCSKDSNTFRVTEQITASISNRNTVSNFWRSQSVTVSTFKCNTKLASNKRPFGKAKKKKVLKSFSRFATTTIVTIVRAAIVIKRRQENQNSSLPSKGKIYWGARGRCFAIILGLPQRLGPRRCQVCTWSKRSSRGPRDIAPWCNIGRVPSRANHPRKRAFYLASLPRLFHTEMHRDAQLELAWNGGLKDFLSKRKFFVLKKKTVANLLKNGSIAFLQGK